MHLSGFRYFVLVLLLGFGTVLGGMVARAAAQTCPTEVFFEPSIGGGRLDAGWTGSAHGQPFYGTRLHFRITCSASTPPCGACTIDGVIPDAAGTTIITPPQPLVADFFETCVALEVSGPPSGTVELETGALTATVPVTARLAGCNQCLGDPVPNDGIRGGTCEGSSSSCDTNGISPLSDFGSASFDCAEDGWPLSFVDLAPLTFSTTPQTVTLGASSPRCTDVDAPCFCSTCNNADAQPCGSNTDCPPSGGNPGICHGRRCVGGSNAGSPCAVGSECPSGLCGRPGQLTSPNACVDGICTPDGNGDGLCAAGPIDLKCANHPNRVCDDDADCDGVVDACTSFLRPCYADNGVDGGSVTVDATATPPVNDVASPTDLGTFSCQGPASDGSPIPDVTFGLPGLVRIHQPGRLVFGHTVFPPDPCPAAPTICRAPAAPRKSSVLLSDREPDDKDRLDWKWTRGAATDVGDFGDPVGTDNYRLCFYGGNALRASILIPPGGTCLGRPCWSAKSTGFTYRNKPATGTGISQIALKAGATGKAKIQVKGSGEDLVMPDLDFFLAFFGPSLHVQLRNLDNGICWGATFNAPFDHKTATQLKDKTD